MYLHDVIPGTGHLLYRRSGFREGGGVIQQLGEEINDRKSSTTCRRREIYDKIHRQQEEKNSRKKLTTRNRRLDMISAKRRNSNDPTVMNHRQQTNDNNSMVRSNENESATLHDESTMALVIPKLVAMLNQLSAPQKMAVESSAQHGRVPSVWPGLALIALLKCAVFVRQPSVEVCSLWAPHRFTCICVFVLFFC